MIYKCSNPAQWHPTLHTKQEHHHPPTAWRKVLITEAEGHFFSQGWWRTIPLCGICHDEYHTLLNSYVKRNSPPPSSELKTYSPYIKSLVAEAWGRRPQGKLPYTIAAEFTDSIFYKEH